MDRCMRSQTVFIKYYYCETDTVSENNFEGLQRSFTYVIVQCSLQSVLAVYCKQDKVRMLGVFVIHQYV